MFDIGWSELLLIGVVALVVVGPKELPGLLRSLGKAIAGVRRMAGDFQAQFNEAMREAELDDLRKEVDALRNTAKGYLNVPDVPSIAKSEIRNSILGAGAVPAERSPDAAASAVAAGALVAPGAATQPEAVEAMLASGRGVGPDPDLGPVTYGTEEPPGGAGPAPDGDRPAERDAPVGSNGASRDPMPVSGPPEGERLGERPHGPHAA